MDQMILPRFVKIVEVGPRDGLQNESKKVSTDIKVQFINLLSESGLSEIEATSFVSPKWVPQLGDHQEVYARIQKKEYVHYPVLVPNLQGLENAIACGVKEIAVFTTPSETFSLRNTNVTVKESLKNIEEVIKKAKQHSMRVRGYLSCVLGCPYEGNISVDAVSELTDRLFSLGCEEVSLGDTIGVGTPNKVMMLLNSVFKKSAKEKLAVHFHDTYGQAIANIYAALQCGIHVIDSSVAGLGGCPYAKGATGNVATEDVLYLLNGLEIETNVNLQKVIKAGEFITQYLDKPTQSKVSRVYLSNRAP